MQVLVIEASTTAAKAMVYDDEKGVIATESENYGPEIDKGGVHNGALVADVCFRLGRKAAAGRDIAAVACGGVWHTILACDGAMSPVSSVYLWNFTGTDEICKTVRDDPLKAADIYRRTGCMPNITYQPYSILYLKNNGFDTRGKLFSSQGGYNFFKLTGERIETKNLMSGMGFLNTHRLVYDEGIMEMCGVSPEQFGTLADYSAARPLLTESANLLGIPAGIPVVPAHSDGSLNQLGNGCMKAGRMTFSVGTSAAIRLSTAAPVLSDPPGTWCYVGVKGWLSGAATNGACSCINWFKEAVLKNKWSFDELGGELLSDAHTPVFTPFVFGERCPGWQDTRRGGFHDLTARDDVAAMFRAVSEGILFNVYQCYKILAGLSGEPDTIILSGGILNSEKWVQMAADIFQRKMELSDNPNASLIGGAALALHAGGALDRLEDFPCECERSVSPRTDAAIARAYEHKFKNYMKYYESAGR